ncbi:MAG TPA: hypothetical protein VFJ06_03625, partial [Halococcus sp.]|nr:hypothetical protein [Halococcus sp.]
MPSNDQCECLLVQPSKQVNQTIVTMSGCSDATTNIPANESTDRNHYHHDGLLVVSPRCSYSHALTVV